VLRLIVHPERACAHYCDSTAPKNELIVLLTQPEPPLSLPLSLELEPPLSPPPELPEPLPLSVGGSTSGPKKLPPLDPDPKSDGLEWGLPTTGL